jgi:ATP-dependent Clp protease ATP-binding subunit ClpX
MKRKNTCCSFCRKSYRDVGPLVEGPDEVYICGECVELCQAIVEQERHRRGGSATGASDVPTAATIRGRLDQLVPNQDEAKAVLVPVALRHLERSGGGPQALVLLIGPTRSSKVYLVRALAFALAVPFAQGDGQSLVKSATEPIEPLFYRLLTASGFNTEAAQRGVVYVDGVDHEPTQEWLLRLWTGEDGAAAARLMDTTQPLFICGGAFVGLDAAIARTGRHPEQPVTADALRAFGVPPALADRFQSIVRVAPLDEEALMRMALWVDFDRMASEAPL